MAVERDPLLSLDYEPQVTRLRFIAFVSIRTRMKKTLLLLCACSLLSGCTVLGVFKKKKSDLLFGNGYVEKLAGKYFNSTEELSNRAAELNGETLAALAESNEPYRNAKLELIRSKRNAILYDMLTISDSLYGELKDRLFAGKASLDTVAKITDLALTGTAAAIGDKGTKTALAAAATFLSGSKLAIDENFYAKQTTTSLIAVMDGERARIRTTLLSNMERAPQSFSLSQGLAAVQEYHRKGSMVDAVVEVTRITTSAAQTQVQALHAKEQTAK